MEEPCLNQCSVFTLGAYLVLYWWVLKISIGSRTISGSLQRIPPAEPLSVVAVVDPKKSQQLIVFPAALLNPWPMLEI